MAKSFLKNDKNYNKKNWTEFWFYHHKFLTWLFVRFSHPKIRNLQNVVWMLSEFLRIVDSKPSASEFVTWSKTWSNIWKIHEKVSQFINKSLSKYVDPETSAHVARINFPFNRTWAMMEIECMQHISHQIRHHTCLPFCRWKKCIRLNTSSIADWKRILGLKHKAIKFKWNVRIRARSAS